MKSIRVGHCWVHKLYEHVHKIRTDLPKLHGWEEHCSNWLSLSLSLLEWPGMTRNDHPNKLELSIRPHSGVDSAQWDWGIKNRCKNIGFYSIFQLSILPLLNNYRYNCDTISSVSVVKSVESPTNIVCRGLMKDLWFKIWELAPNE